MEVYNGKAYTFYLSLILNDINKGKILLEHDFFPKKSVSNWKLEWSDTQKYKFMTNVIKNFPIGIITIWEYWNNDEKYQYILDGKERIKTLYQALINKNNKNQNLYYDLEEKTIKNKWYPSFPYEKNENPKYLPFTNLLDSRKLLKFQKNIPKDKPDWLDNADELSVIFRNYKILVLNIATNDIKTAENIYVLSNSN